MASKTREGVNNSSMLPQSPPRTVASEIGKTGTPQTLPKPSRYTQELANPPGKRENVLVAFAATDGTPTEINAGRDTNDPPPAKAFMLPASIPASNRSNISFIGTAGVRI